MARLGATHLQLARIVVAGLALMLGACDPPDLTHGDDYQAALREADAARVAGNMDTAIPLYDRALQANPQGSEAKLGLGQALLAIGAAEQAAAQFRDVLARHGDNSTARRGLAAALIAMGQPTLAEQQVDEALRANANDYRALNLLGVLLDMQGRHAEAQANYRRGLDLMPDDPGLRSNYGLSLAITGQAQAAIGLLVPVASSRQSTPRIRQNLAFAYAMAGDLGNALQLCRRDMDEIYAQRQLAYYAQLRSLPPEMRSAEFRRNPMFAPQGAPHATAGL
ncbi:MAG: tetratricopeptide repeat protein [Proteobacteria bacterium]|nr:tetratricopeptide repeat protein [Pseudomonadota bacterium]